MLEQQPIKAKHTQVSIFLLFNRWICCRLFQTGVNRELNFLADLTFEQQHAPRVHENPAKHWLSSLCFNRVVGTQEQKANMVRDIRSLGSGSKARPRSSLTINSAKAWLSSALIYPKLKSRLWSQKAKLGLEDLSIRRLGICSGSHLRAQAWLRPWKLARLPLLQGLD